jgi:Flp pilus assembly protein CpaB
MMKSRGLVVGIAAVLTVAAAAFVYLYTNGVKNEAATGGSLSTVIVAKQDIPANTALDPLIEQGVFTQLRVPSDAVVDGAVTDPGELRGLTTTAPILANEQIPASRLDTGQAPKGGPLGISDGNVAVSFEVDAAAGVEGAITKGSYITVYATYDSPRYIPGNTPKQIVEKLNQAAASGSASDVGVTLPSITITLIPAVRVLDVQNPTVDSEGNTDSSNVSLTLDLNPVDAQNLVYAQKTATTWIGLLPPRDTQGHPLPFSVIPTNRLVGKAGA